MGVFLSDVYFVFFFLAPLVVFVILCFNVFPVLAEVDTDPLKLKYARKNPRMGDYVQNTGLDIGFNLIYEATIFIGGFTN